MGEIGNYNFLLKDCPAYQKCNVSFFLNIFISNFQDGELSFEESHDLFRGAFTDGFPWEVLKVLVGPPEVLFTWRHWGVLKGKFQDNTGHDEQLEMFGLSIR